MRQSIIVLLSILALSIDMTNNCLKMKHINLALLFQIYRYVSTYTYIDTDRFRPFYLSFISFHVAPLHQNYCLTISLLIQWYNCSLSVFKYLLSTYCVSHFLAMRQRAVKKKKSLFSRNLYFTPTLSRDRQQTKKPNISYV